MEPCRHSRRWKKSASRGSAIFRSAICPPARSAASRWRGFSSPPRPVWILDEPATALDLGSQEKFAQAMAEHRAGGGMILAATHAPLGLLDAKELRLDAAASAARISSTAGAC